MTPGRIVAPYSRSAWIAAIHSGIDVAPAAGLDHVAGATGAASEAAGRKLYRLPDVALIDMMDIGGMGDRGDIAEFVGGMVKYLRRCPVPRVTIAGGVAKMTKLAQGPTDLHAGRGPVDPEELASHAAETGDQSAHATPPRKRRR